MSIQQDDALILQANQAQDIGVDYSADDEDTEDPAGARNHMPHHPPHGRGKHPVFDYPRLSEASPVAAPAHPVLYAPALEQDLHRPALARLTPATRRRDRGLIADKVTR